MKTVKKSSKVSEADLTDQETRHDTSLLLKLFLVIAWSVNPV